MSNRRDNKGFTKLAPTEELALSEMAAMNSGSELELLDLTSTEHRRGGGDEDRTGFCCYGWCVTGCLLLLTVTVVVLSLSVVYLVYNMHQLQTTVSAMEHRVNLMNSSVVEMQKKVARDHRAFDRKYTIMVASTAHSITKLNDTFVAVQKSLLDDNEAKAFVLNELQSFNSSLAVLVGFTKQVSYVYLSMAKADSRMKSMSDQLIKLTKAQGDLDGEMDKLINTASADHDLTQALQMQTTSQLNQFTDEFHNLQETAVNMSKQLEQLQWVPHSLQDLTESLLNTSQMINLTKALAHYDHTTQPPLSVTTATTPTNSTPSVVVTTETTPPTNSTPSVTIATTPANSVTTETTPPTNSSVTNIAMATTNSETTPPTNSSVTMATTPTSSETTPPTNSSVTMATNSTSMFTPSQTVDNSTLATEDNPHTSTQNTSTVDTSTTDTPTNTTDTPTSTTDTPTNTTDTPTYTTDTPTSTTDTPTSTTDTPTSTTNTPTSTADTSTNTTDTPTNTTDIPTVTNSSTSSVPVTPNTTSSVNTVGRVSTTPLPATPTGAHKPVQLLEAVLERFSQLDADNSKSLEWSEFSNALNDRGIFNNLDVNKKNGKVTRKELEAAINFLKKNNSTR